MNIIFLTQTLTGSNYAGCMKVHREMSLEGVQKRKGSPYREDLPYDIMIEQNKKPLLGIIPIFSYVTLKGTLTEANKRGHVPDFAFCSGCG